MKTLPGPDRPDRNYAEPIASDAEGRLTLPVLIPGATYRFIDRTTFQDPAGPQIRKEFTVKPGARPSTLAISSSRNHSEALELEIYHDAISATSPWTRFEPTP